MALKGLDIFKLTPKTNCKECGSPTCMAFAMKVAQGAVELKLVLATQSTPSEERLFLQDMRKLS